MDTLSYIDEYFTSPQSEEVKREFEKRIAEDDVFAEEVSFYLSAKQLIKEQSAKERWKNIYAEYKKTNKIGKQSTGVIRKLWPYVAAAAVLAAVIIGWSIFSKTSSPEQLADKYIKENFQTLGVAMSGKEDSLQKGLQFINEGKLNESLIQFETIAARDTSSFEAKKYAGIVSLRLQQYDKAINYFSQLEGYTELYSNPGKFYKALTLLKRNRPADKQEATNLLEQVVQNNLEGKENAEKLLKAIQ